LLSGDDLSESFLRLREAFQSKSDRSIGDLSAADLSKLDLSIDDLSAIADEAVLGLCSKSGPP
jgi:hypothetical protein